MTVRITTELHDGVVTLMPEDDIVASALEELRPPMFDALDQAETGVELDFSRVNQIDSLGISLVVALFKHARKRNFSFRVINVRDNIGRVFDLFKLSQFFPVEPC